MGENYKEANLTREKIHYPAYHTTSRFQNLYGDIRTFVRELIQNADDAGAQSIEIIFKQNVGEIVVINDGSPFDDEDIKRLLTPSLGGKTMDQTGSLNIGALSILSITDQPVYHSGHTLLKFDLDHSKEDFVPYLDKNYHERFDGTKIILPLANSRLSRDDKEK